MASVMLLSRDAVLRLLLIAFLSRGIITPVSAFSSSAIVAEQGESTEVDKATAKCLTTLSEDYFCLFLDEECLVNLNAIENFNATENSTCPLEAADAYLHALFDEYHVLSVALSPLMLGGFAVLTFGAKVPKIGTQRGVRFFFLWLFVHAALMLLLILSLTLYVVSYFSFHWRFHTCMHTALQGVPVLHLAVAGLPLCQMAAVGQVCNLALLAKAGRLVADKVTEKLEEYEKPLLRGSLSFLRWLCQGILWLLSAMFYLQMLPSMISGGVFAFGFLVSPHSLVVLVVTMAMLVLARCCSRGDLIRGVLPGLQKFQLGRLVRSMLFQQIQGKSEGLGVSAEVRGVLLLQKGFRCRGLRVYGFIFFLSMAWGWLVLLVPAMELASSSSSIESLAGALFMYQFAAPAGFLGATTWWHAFRRKFLLDDMIRGLEQTYAFTINLDVAVPPIGDVVTLLEDCEPALDVILDVSHYFKHVPSELLLGSIWIAALATALSAVRMIAINLGAFLSCFTESGALAVWSFSDADPDIRGEGADPKRKRTVVFPEIFGEARSQIKEQESEKLTGCSPSKGLSGEAPSSP